MASYRYFYNDQLKVDPTTGTKCRTGQLNHQFVEQKFVGGVWVGIGDNDGVRYGDIAGAGCRFREGINDIGDYDVDVETKIAGFLLAEGDGWTNCGSVSGYWALKVYVDKVLSEGGIISDEVALATDIQPLIDNGLINKIAFLINPDYGVITPDPNELEGCVFFTFDDGFAGVYDNTFPLFVAKGMKATFFINGFPERIAETEGDRVDSNVLYPGQGYGFCLIWSEVLTMHNSGAMEIADHTYAHNNVETSIRSVNLAQGILQDAIFVAHGLTPPKHMAYPGGYGSYSAGQEISITGRRLKRVTSAMGIEKAMQYSAIHDSRICVDDYVFFNGAPDVALAKTDMDRALALKQPVGFITHNTTPTQAIYYGQVLDYAKSIGLKDVTFSELATKMDKIRGRYFNVGNDLSLSDLFEYSPVVNKRIYFNDDLSVITTGVADAYIASGYEVGFLDDFADAAMAYTIPNASFRAKVRTNSADSGMATFSIGTGVKVVNLNTTPGLTGYTNGYTARLLTGGRVLLYRVDNGAVTIIGDNTYGGVWTTAHTLSIVLNAGRVEVWNNGLKVIDVADATYSSGNILISAGVYLITNKATFEMTSFIDSGGLNDDFSNPAVSVLNYTKYEGSNDYIYLFKPGKLIFGSEWSNAFGIERIGSFTSVTSTFKLYLGGTMCLRSFINRGGQDEGSGHKFDYNTKSITGDIAGCGLHLLKNVMKLYLNVNALTGSIPAELNELFMLEWLYLNGNQITGYEQGAFLNKQRLVYIDLHDNLLTTAAVNQILIDVRDNVFQFKKGGTLNLAGTGNEAPSGDAGDPATGLGALYQLQNAIAELDAAANWTVTTN